MLKWSTHPHAHVRRLASEGCRPRLPWAMGVPALKQNPLPILRILENLKRDDSEFVRRSVANNLNDIAKDHPDVVVDICSRWRGSHINTDWILRHGCRTLLKKGNKTALLMHGFNPDTKAVVRSLRINTNKIKVGDELQFDFQFQTLEKKSSTYRLDYAIDYLTSSGKTSRKIFKITEKEVAPGKMVTIERRQSFRDLTTRKHHPGKHTLTILANGKKLATTEFVVC
ncbi:MAG TPA: DNA alkylation repair protein, partial [Chryseosolibacter sp.]|nr:DNA alkylation repair protein [Chryseosolibacter sp.]